MKILLICSILLKVTLGYGVGANKTNGVANDADTDVTLHTDKELIHGLPIEKKKSENVFESNSIINLCHSNEVCEANRSFPENENETMKFQAILKNRQLTPRLKMKSEDNSKIGVTIGKIEEALKRAGSQIVSKVILPDLYALKSKEKNILKKILPKENIIMTSTITADNGVAYNLKRIARDTLGTVAWDHSSNDGKNYISRYQFGVTIKPLYAAYMVHLGDSSKYEIGVQSELSGNSFDTEIQVKYNSHMCDIELVRFNVTKLNKLNFKFDKPIGNEGRTAITNFIVDRLHGTIIPALEVEIGRAIYKQVSRRELQICNLLKKENDQIVPLLL